MTKSLESRVRTRLNELESFGLVRTLKSPQGIDLSSNDYLGLAKHPLVVERMSDALHREGCGSTGSRLLRGHRETLADVERQFAIFKGTKRSLYFSSGYLANIAVLTTFPEEGDIVYSDERNHASLIDGIRLSRAKCVIFPHNDVDTLAKLADEENRKGQAFVVVESLFSMDGDIAPLSNYADFCRKSGAVLVVDEAHAVGLYGKDGSGLIKATGVNDDVMFSINTAGKALGVAGAFVAGSELTIEYLIQCARPFIFSTAPPPAIAAALKASLTIVANEPNRRERVQTLSKYLRNKLVAAGFDIPLGNSQIISLVVGENHVATMLARELQKKGFDVRAIRPPSVPEGTARLRISVNANLSKVDLDRFVLTLKQCSMEVG